MSWTAKARVRKEHNRCAKNQEDGSGLNKDLHDGLAEEARNPRVMHIHPCWSLEGSAQILHLKVDRCGRLLLDDGKVVQGEPAASATSSSSVTDKPDSSTGATRAWPKQEQRGLVSVVLVVVGRGVTAAGPHGEPNEDLTQNFAPH